MVQPQAPPLPEISANHSAKRGPVPPTRRAPANQHSRTSTTPPQEPIRARSAAFEPPPPHEGARPASARAPANHTPPVRREPAGTGENRGNRRGWSPRCGGRGSDWSLTACGRSAARTRRRRAAVNAAAMMLPPGRRELSRDLGTAHARRWGDKFETSREFPPRAAVPPSRRGGHFVPGSGGGARPRGAGRERTAVPPTPFCPGAATPERRDLSPTALRFEGEKNPYD